MSADRPDATWMVVTLKSGVQIRVRVTGCASERNRISKQITRLTWDYADEDPPEIVHLDLTEVAAVHTERPGEQEADRELAELEAEVERLRETLARARVFVWELEPSGDWLRAEHRGGDAWRITRDGD
ncbi:MAG TPA: hypothetical protein VKZ89_05230, partial [Thermobifida alba]|nr:hypothetical protein [Thermobifida alba]